MKGTAGEWAGIRIGRPWGRMGELAYRISIGGRGTSGGGDKAERMRPGPGTASRSRLTRPTIGPAGLDNSDYVIGQGCFEWAWGRCT